MRTLGLLILVLVLPGLARADDAFDARLDALGFSFEPPEGWKPVPIVPNRQMEYEAALASPDGRFELRIALRDMGPAVAEIEAAARKPDTIGVKDPSVLWPALAQTTALNISGGEMAELTTYSKETLDAYYGGADWGGMIDMKPQGDFAGKHARCVMVAIQEGNASGYLMLMYPTVDALQEAREAVSSLRVRGPSQSDGENRRR